MKHNTILLSSWSFFLSPTNIMCKSHPTQPPVLGTEPRVSSILDKCCTNLPVNHNRFLFLKGYSKKGIQCKTASVYIPKTLIQRHFRTSFQSYFITFNSMYVWVCGAQRVWSLELRVQVVVTCPMQMVETDLGPLQRQKCLLHGASPQPPWDFSFKNEFKHIPME